MKKQNIILAAVLGAILVASFTLGGGAMAAEVTSASKHANTGPIAAMIANLGGIFKEAIPVISVAAYCAGGLFAVLSGLDFYQISQNNSQVKPKTAVVKFLAAVFLIILPTMISSAAEQLVGKEGAKKAKTNAQVEANDVW